MYFLWMNVLHSDVQAGFPSQGDFRSVNPVDRRVPGGCNMRGLHLAAGNHTHLHQAETHLLVEVEVIEHCPIAHTELCQCL